MSIMRISGLASGLDIDSMVSQLMKAERIPVDKLKQKKQILEWTRDAYREMNSALLDLRNSVFTMKLQGTFLARRVSSSNESVVTATASASALQGTYTLKVTQLAQSASMVSTDVIGANGDTSKTLNSLNNGVFTGTVSLQVIGEKGNATVTVNGSDSLATFISNVNAQSSVTGVQVSYDANLDRLFFTSTTTGKSARVQFDAASDPGTADSTNLNNLMSALQLSSVSPNAEVQKGSVSFANGSTTFLTNTGTFSITVNGTKRDFAITGNTTKIGDLINQINNDSELKKNGISAYLDKDNKLVIARDNKTTTVSFSDNASNAIVNELGLGSLVTSTTAYLLTGQNAKVTFNNIAAEYTSNVFTISGITFTAKNAQGANDPPVNITVTQDVDTVYNFIKSFVDKYNEVIDKINKKISEERYRDYPPLTDDQKKEMKDDDIKRWEEKAKSGLLRGDSLLSSGLDGLRRALSDPVSGLPVGDLNQLAQIGITTGSYMDKGKLYIDEAKLRDAIATKPEQVMRQFSADDGSSTSTAGDGLAVRLYDQVNNLMKQLTDKAGASYSSSLFDNSLIGKDIRNVDDQISRLNQKLTDLENRYYRQFTAMEQAINRMNSQSAWLAQQFGGGAS